MEYFEAKNPPIWVSHIFTSLHLIVSGRVAFLKMLSQLIQSFVTVSSCVAVLDKECAAESVLHSTSKSDCVFPNAYKKLSGVKKGTKRAIRNMLMSKQPDFYSASSKHLKGQSVPRVSNEK